ncbi:MAG: ribonuclease III [Deltaproteobacteria bacterium]|nr:ribonuclease III [Deltaproteobacteria bacterium]
MPVSETGDYADLEVVLGYTFRDRTLLEQALRHASFCNEASRDPTTKLRDNQRLEFLGDAVLSLTVSQRLMFRFPDAHEGDLSVTRAQVVSEEGLSDVARTLGFGNWILLGKGEEKSGGRAKPKILADAFEAIVAAVYLDGGFPAANDLVERLLTDRINAAEIKNFYDFKTRLQETAQARLKATPTYRVVQELGPDHDKRFVVAVTIGTEEWARAVGKSKKEAEQMAAAEAHFRLEGSDAGVRPKRDR